MDRYQDNLSPEPASIHQQQQQQLAFNNCFKTPDLNTFQSYSHYQYPTPPSDNEETYQLNTNKMVNFTPPAPSTTTTTVNNQNYSQINKSLEEEIPAYEQQNQQTNSRFKRRSRTTFSKTQLDVLEQTFQKSQYPEIKIVDDLSTMLNLSTERISIWFQNRRARFKKARKLNAQENGFLTDKSTYQPKYTLYDNNVSNQYITPPLQAVYPKSFTTSDHPIDSCLNKTTSNASFQTNMFPQSNVNAAFNNNNNATFYSQSIDSNFYYQNNNNYTQKSNFMY